MDARLDGIARALAEGQFAMVAEGLRALEPDLADAGDRGRWTAIQILLLDGQENTVEAGKILDRAIGNDAEDLAFVFSLATQLAESGADVRAERALKRLCDLDPRNPFAYANLGVFLGRLGRFQEAADAYSDALDRDPGFAPAYLQRAYCLFTLGHLEASGQDYRAYVEMEPGDASAWDALGMVEAERGQGDAALDAHARAIALNPEQPLWRVNAATTARRLGRIDALTRFADDLDRLVPDRWHCSLVRGYRQQESGDFGAAWTSFVEAFSRAECSGEPEGLAVTGHAVLWYALTAKHSDEFDTYMKRVLGRGVFSEGILAAIRASEATQSSVARNHEVILDAAAGSVRESEDHAEGGVSGRYRRRYEVVADNANEAAAIALAFEGWCGGVEASIVSVRAISDVGEGLRGVYAVSPPHDADIAAAHGEEAGI